MLGDEVDVSISLSYLERVFASGVLPFSLLLGHAVPESCIVTPERVYHWFANRRKELNKRKRLCKLDIINKFDTLSWNSVVNLNFIYSSRQVE